MENKLYQHVIETPDAIAIEDGKRHISYSELFNQADNLATSLRHMGLQQEEPVCLLFGPEADMIISQVAVRCAGLTSVPLDPSSMPRLRLVNMLKTIGVHYIITTATDGEGLKDLGFNVLTPLQLSSSKTSENGSSSKLLELGYDFRSHVLFTSGSTGTPKAVQIREKSILHLATRMRMTPLKSTDRVSFINNPGFDISIFEIWASLLSGATIVVVSRETATDPFAFRDFIAEQKINIVFMASSLFAINAQACPDSFQSARHVLITGEIANMSAIRSVLESGKGPEYLWNAYGPVEALTFSTTHLVTKADLDYDNISIGKADGDTLLFILDENFRAVSKDGGETGEIFLGGPGLSLGYIDREEENQKRFLYLEGKSLGSENEDGALRLYRTGDLARWRPSSPDLLEYVGRRDLQVKQSGFRVELGEIEQTLMASGWFRAVVVLQLRASSSSSNPFLVAFVILKLANQTNKKQIEGFAKSRLPDYMIPRLFSFHSDFPLTDHSKVDKRALEEIYWKKHQKSTNEAAFKDDGLTSLKAKLRDIWIGILHHAEFSEEDDIFVMGASSIDSAALIWEIRVAFGKEISMKALHENSRFSGLALYIDELAEGGDAANDEVLKWKSDAQIADSLISPVPNWLSEDEGRVFLTGATGFLGAHFLSRLLLMPEVKQIACLARSRGKTKSAFARIQNALVRYDLWDPTSSLAMHEKVIVLEGDITKENLGLEKSKFDWIADWASIVFHLAAKVNFCEPYQAHYNDNVLGTKNTLEIAIRGRRKPFHYMSSIDVWGVTGLVLGTKKVLEDESLETHAKTLSYDTGYAQSTFVCEEMVRRMRASGELDVVIYRPGFIIGDSKHGRGNPDDFFARLMVGCIRLGAFPYLPNQRMEYVTVDYVCDAVLHIASSDKNIGKSYSLVSPDPALSANLERTHRIINEAGHPVEMLPYWQWVKRLHDTNNDEENPLMPLMPLLQEPVLGKLARFETSKNTPHYVATNLVEALKDAPSIRYIPFDSDMLNRFLDFWTRKAFYRI